MIVVGSVLERRVGKRGVACYLELRMCVFRHLRARVGDEKPSLTDDEVTTTYLSGIYAMSQEVYVHMHSTPANAFVLN